MKLRGLWGGVLVAALVCAPVAHASLRSAIENALESWFDSAGKVAIILKERIVPSLRIGECALVMDRSTDGLAAKCKTAAGENQTILLSGNPYACVDESGTGDLVCKTVSTFDQNLLSPAAANRLSLYDNDVDLTPDPTCGNYGIAGTQRTLDQIEGSTDAYIPCAGTQPYMVSTVEMPFGIIQDDVAEAPAANECQCLVGRVTGWIKDLNNIEVYVQTADGVTTGTSSIGIYSVDGQVKYFTSGAITTAFQSTGYKTIANTTTTPEAIPPGEILLCLAVDSNATDLRLIGTLDSGATSPKMGSFVTTGSGCNGGAAAATLTPTITYAARAPWYVSLSGL